MAVKHLDLTNLPDEPVERIKQEIDRLTKMISSLGGHIATAKVAEIMPDTDVYACAKYILKEGTKDEKRDLLNHVNSELLISDGKIGFDVKKTPRQPHYSASQDRKFNSTSSAEYNV
jgi:hypothetical protein